MSRQTPHLAVRLARSAEEISAAQALRYRIFVQELGALGGSMSDAAARLEVDRYDAHCEHILLLDPLRDDAVIGTTRVMTQAGADRAGGFATEEEFDISGLRRSGRPLLEVGRTCLLPGYRGGGAMHRLWQGLAALVAERRIGLLFGLASFHGTAAEAFAQPLACLQANHLAPEDLRPRSRMTIPAEGLRCVPLDRKAAVLATPPLIKAYLRLGGRVGEGIYIDHAFGCIDVCMVLDTRLLSDRSRAVYSVPLE